jgi:methionyl-tRNA formyltransferase
MRAKAANGASRDMNAANAPDGGRPLRAVVVGAVGSTKVAIEAFARSDWILTLVVTLPPEANARHSDYVDLSGACHAAGTNLFHTRQINDPDTIHAIRSARPDYVFVIGWSQICGAEFCAITPQRIIGYHPAAIPRLRGRAVIPWTILLDEKITAGTLFWIDDGVDSGPVLAQQFFHVSPTETASSLYARHMAVLSSVMDEGLAAIATGAAPRGMQDERCATYAARRSVDDGAIDWTASAVVIDRLIRATTRPYPGAFTFSGGDRLIVWRSSIPADSMTYHAQPGQIVAIRANVVTVQTGEGLLCLEEWEADGKATLPVHSILGRK